MNKLFALAATTAAVSTSTCCIGPRAAGRSRSGCGATTG